MSFLSKLNKFSFLSLSKLLFLSFRSFIYGLLGLFIILILLIISSLFTSSLILLKPSCGVFTYFFALSLASLLFEKTLLFCIISDFILSIFKLFSSFSPLLVKQGGANKSPEFVGDKTLFLLSRIFWFSLLKIVKLFLSDSIFIDDFEANKLSKL